MNPGVKWIGLIACLLTGAALFLCGVANPSPHDPAGAAPAQTPISLYDVFSGSEPASHDSAAPGPAKGNATGTGTTDSTGAAAGRSASPITPTPFVSDPLCPPLAVPPLALLPTPTPVPTPSLTPIPLPPGMTRADLYSPPGQMGRRKDPVPFLRSTPGLLPDRSVQLADIEIRNSWKYLCAEVTFIPLHPDTGASTTESSNEADARESSSGEKEAIGGGDQRTSILYLPGQGDHFRLAPGEWRVVLRVWEPEPPYPERTVEYPVQELDPRGTYVATLSPRQERDFRAETHPIVVNTHEDNLRQDPLSRLGRPEPTPGIPLKIGRLGTP